MKSKAIQSAAANAGQVRREALRAAIAFVPRGAWAVGVSGGADSVALLHLLHDRNDLRLRVAHLNHQTRGDASDGDERFVAALATELGLACTCHQRSKFKTGDAPRNPSAQYRAARLAMFRHVVETEHLDGVILAHHADDQAETILHRLLRGSGERGLAGMHQRTRIDGLLILRPLLQVPGQMLREELVTRSIAWREDASNASPLYFRNRLRRILQNHAVMRDAAIHLGVSCDRWRRWIDRATPQLPARFGMRSLGDLPAPLALHAARRWLRERGCTSDELASAAASIVRMATDAASPARLQVPGGLFIRRRGGEIFAEISSTASSADPQVRSR